MSAGPSHLGLTGSQKPDGQVRRRDQFVRSPGQGLWESGGATEKDNIAVIEVMVECLDHPYRQSLRERLELELSQQ
jgi:hypothetical protein